MDEEQCGMALSHEASRWHWGSCTTWLRRWFQGLQTEHSAESAEVQRVQKAMFPLHSWRRLQMQSQSEDKYKRSYLYSVEKENK